MAMARINIAVAALNESGKTKRLHLNLSETAFSQLQELALQTNLSLSQVISLGLSLVRIAVKEGERGNTLVIADNTGDALRELVFPWSENTSDRAGRTLYE